MTVDTAISVTPGPPSPPKFMTLMFNIVFLLVLRSPLHGLLSKRFILLSFRGRKSGKRYTLVVGYLREGDELEIFSPRGWWRNLRGENASVTLLLEGKWRRGIAEAFHGDETVVDATFRFIQKSPSLIRMYHIELDSNGQPKRESVRQATRNNALIRIRLMPAT